MQNKCFVFQIYCVLNDKGTLFVKLFLSRNKKKNVLIFSFSLYNMSQNIYVS